jgi:hypothetical protein
VKELQFIRPLMIWLNGAVLGMPQGHKREGDKNDDEAQERDT